MCKVSIELDVFPNCLGIKKSYDYIDYFCNQFFYEHLQDHVNCLITTEDNIKYSIQLFDYWINKGITSKEFINSFYWNMISESPYKLFVPYIKKDANNLAINYINDSLFEIELIAPIKEFTKMIQSRYIVPVSDNSCEIKSGDYDIIERTDQRILIENRNKKLYIELLISCNTEISRKRFLDGKIDITCPSNYSPKLLLEDTQLVKHTGSLVYYCFCSEKCMAELIGGNREYINKNICEVTNGFITPISSFYDIKCENIINTNTNININATCLGKEYELFYSNFYPNKELAIICSRILEENGCKIKLIEVPSYSNFKDRCSSFSMYIGVTFPLYESEHAVGMNFVAVLDSKKQKSFSKALIIEDSDSLYEIMKCVGGYVPLGRGNFWYYKQNESYISISEYGNIYFDEEVV